MSRRVNRCRRGFLLAAPGIQFRTPEAPHGTTVIDRSLEERLLLVLDLGLGKAPSPGRHLLIGVDRP